jgi:hypothetical protein
MRKLVLVAEWGELVELRGPRLRTFVCVCLFNRISGEGEEVVQ